MTPDSLRELFDRLRHDPAHHLGMGDIRLTMGQQDEIADAWQAQLWQAQARCNTAEADFDAIRHALHDELDEAQADNAALRERRDRIEGLKWENAALRERLGEKQEHDLLQGVMRWFYGFRTTDGTTADKRDEGVCWAGEQFRRRESET
jgi:hypothetical protein